MSNTPVNNLDVTGLKIVDIRAIAPELDATLLYPVMVDGVEYPKVDGDKVLYPIAEITSDTLKLPLPHWINPLGVDVRRIRDALAKLDTDSGRQDAALASAINALRTDMTGAATKGDLTTHANLKNAHGATAAATANTIILRDAAARAKVANPSATTDIANKAYVDSAVAGSVKVTALSDATNGTRKAADTDGGVTWKASNDNSLPRDASCVSISGNNAVAIA